MIKRSVLTNLKKHLEEKEMTVLMGARQVGKTYLMKQLEKYLQERGEKTVFLNLDIERNKQFLKTQNDFLRYIQLQVGKPKAYIFIDEIQRKENAGLFLKGLYDMELPHKFILSGSGSLDIKAHIKESMAGRKKIFNIEPITFAEFANYKTDYKYENRLQDFFDIEDDSTKKLLKDYMMFGGYPRVVIADTLEKKISEMDEIYRSYIERDITDLIGVEKPEAFTNLLKITASQIGSLVNVAELSSTIGISVKTVTNYLWYLEETFILKKVRPYYKNIRSEITKTPVYYFYDTGLRNYLLGLFGVSEIPSVLSGHLFENVVFNMLRQNTDFASTQINFWRTVDNAEVDFVVNNNLNIIPIEAKYTKLKSAKTTKSFKSFLDKYKPKNAFVVHTGGNMKDNFKGTNITFLPFYRVDKAIYQP